MNVTKHYLLTSLRNTMLERLPPIPHEIFYGTSKKNDTSASTKKKQSLMYVPKKLKLSGRGKRKAGEGDTLPGKKRKREIKSAVVKSAVNQQVKISTRGKKGKTPFKSAEIVTSAVKQEMRIGAQEKKGKSPLKLAAVNETNTAQDVQITKRRGLRKRKIPLKLAEVDETVVKQEMQIETREKKRKSPLKTAAVDGVEQNVEAEKEKNKKSPLLKSTKVVIIDPSVQNSTRGRKKKSEIKTRADVGQSAEVEKEKESMSQLKTAAVGGPNVGQNATRRGRKKKLSLKPAEIGTTGLVQSVLISTRGREKKSLPKTEADVGQIAEAEKGEESKSPIKTTAVGVTKVGQNAEVDKEKKSKSPQKTAVSYNVGPNVKRRGRKKKLSLKPSEIVTTGFVQSVRILTRGSKRKLLPKTEAVEQIAEAERGEKNKSPQKTAIGVTNIGPNVKRQGRKKKLSLKPAEIDTTGFVQSVRILTRGSKRKSLPKTVADVRKNEKEKSPAKTVKSEMNAEPEKEKDTASVKKNTRQSSQVKSEKIAPPAQSPMKKQTGTNNSPARKKLLMKSQIDMNGRKRTIRGRVKMAMQKMKAGKSGPIVNIKIEKTKTDEVADLKEQEKILSPSKKMPKISAVPTPTVTSKKFGAVRKLSWNFSISAQYRKLTKGYKLRKRMVKKFATSTTPRMLRKETSSGGTFVKKEPEEVNADDESEEQGSAGLEQNDAETSEVESAVGCSTKEEQLEEQPQVPPSENNQEELPECSIDLVDCLVKPYNGADYKPRKQKDPLKPKKYRFKKLPPEVKPEPLIDYEFEVTDEVDALSLDEIVIPDALPYEFDSQTVPIPSSSHHEDVYEAVPMASTSQHKDTEEGGLVEDSDLEVEVKPVPVKRTYKKKEKNQSPSQVYNLRTTKTQPGNKQVDDTYEVSDYDVLNTRVLLTKKKGQNYWC